MKSWKYKLLKITQNSLMYINSILTFITEVPVLVTLTIFSPIYVQVSEHIHLSEYVYKLLSMFKTFYSGNNFPTYSNLSIKWESFMYFSCWKSHQGTIFSDPLTFSTVPKNNLILPTVWDVIPWKFIQLSTGSDFPCESNIKKMQ